MLAAQCVFTMLSAEHSVIRRNLSSLMEVLASGGWERPGPALDQLAESVQFLHTYERDFHAGKERECLLPALQGRCPEADRLVLEVELADAHHDVLLSRALALLQALARHESQRAPELEGLLRHYRASVLQLQSVEESELFRVGLDLLCGEDWSQIASAMSRGSRHAAAPRLPAWLASGAVASRGLAPRPVH
jgi:hemerythrin-like domain-containing protein